MILNINQIDKNMKILIEKVKMKESLLISTMNCMEKDMKKNIKKYMKKQYLI